MLKSASSRDLILSIGTEMNKTPEQLEKSLVFLEDNMLHTVESLRDITKWINLHDLGLPLGLVNKIMQHLEETT